MRQKCQMVLNSQSSEPLLWCACVTVTKNIVDLVVQCGAFDFMGTCISGRILLKPSRYCNAARIWCYFNQWDTPSHKPFISGFQSGIKKAVYRRQSHRAGLILYTHERTFYKYVSVDCSPRHSVIKNYAPHV